MKEIFDLWHVFIVCDIADGKEAIGYGRFAIEKDAGSRRKEEGNEARL